jgi:ribonuclease VapC
LESRLVLAFSKGIPVQMVDDFLAGEQIAVIPFDEALSGLAFEAYGRYGKGRHPARLNMGDCAAYALAKSRGWPLLYKGEDFVLTDIERA